MKVLIVDDSNLLLVKLMRHLGENYNVDSAVNGREGLDAFYLAHKEKDPYDIILLDLDMPTMRGEQTLHAIRSYEDNLGISNVKVIIISANHDSNKILELFKIGCEYYIRKPFNKKDLEKAIQFVFSH